jgi:hypothetical protein
MTLPANIRVNAQLPFPSLVTGSGPITIGKQNGIWIVGFSIDVFGSIVPPVPNYPTYYLLGYDATNKAFFKVSITNLIASVNTTVGIRTQRSVTATSFSVGPTDQIINCRITAAAACALPLAASRLGQPVTIKDLGQATAHPITLTANVGDTNGIDGAPTYVIADNFGWVTLVPFNDGANTGWMVQ